MRLWDILNEQAAQLLSEGGNAFPDVGTIYIDEIQPTLDYITKKTTVKDVHGRVLGSTGKKEYSGDIDIAVEPKTPEELEEFIASLKKSFGESNVRRIGSLVTSRVPIQNYDPEHDGRQPRTGFVQVDYLFGDPEWMKLFYHSPRPEESKLKGTQRNMALAALAGSIDRKQSEEKDQFGRAVEAEQWKWSGTHGLVRVIRKVKKNKKTGEWLKGQEDIPVGDSVRNADEIAKILFKGKAGKEALNSLESVVNAVDKIFPEKEKEDFFKRLAYGAMKENGWEEMEYPEQVKKYMVPDNNDVNQAR